MKRILFLLAFTFLFCSCNEKDVRFSFDKDIVNVGSIEAESLTSVAFKLSNTGNEAIEIENIFTDCHCTVVDLTKKTILPQKSIEIIIDYDGSGWGFFEQTATVYFKDLEFPHILIIRGNVIPLE